MLKAINALNSFLGLILALALVGALAFGTWMILQARYSDRFALGEAERAIEEKQAEISRLNETLSAKDTQLAENAQQIQSLEIDLDAAHREMQRLELSLRLMKVDHRLARIEVVRQEGSIETNDLVTEFNFTEIDPNGQPIGEPRSYRIEGDLVYLDSWVIKFTDQHVESGDPLRSTSICLFRRLFGERMKPSEGFLIDSEGVGPLAYRSGGKQSDFEQQLWTRFWDLANDPEIAAELGVRAAHGEAPYVKLKSGRSYRVQLRASDGLSIVPEDEPPATSDGTTT